jgi:hypothetical protein
MVILVMKKDDLSNGTSHDASSVFQLILKAGDINQLLIPRSSGKNDYCTMNGGSYFSFKEVP